MTMQYRSLKPQAIALPYKSYNDYEQGVVIMKRAFAISVSLIFIFASRAFPCFSPTDDFATEIVLNKPGASYDLNIIENSANVSFDEGAFIYRCHFDMRVAVILRELGDEVPVKGLSVRIQIPTKTVVEDGQEDLTEAVDVSKDEFDFKSAMKTELTWLVRNEIVGGIEEQDIAEIAQISEAGLAGWNERIVYEREKWLPYNRTPNPQLIRAQDCGGFALEKLVYEGEILIPDPNPSSVSSDGKLATTWGKIKKGL